MQQKKIEDLIKKMKERKYGIIYRHKEIS